MTPEVFVSAVGVILSLLFSYFPSLNVWFAQKSEAYKSLFMIGLMLATALVAVGLSCAGLLTDLTGVSLTCDRAGFIEVARAFFYGLILNQTTHRLSPEAKNVRIVKGKEVPALHSK